MALQITDGPAGAIGHRLRIHGRRAAAFGMARKRRSGHVLVTILCNGGCFYQSTLFNRSFLQSQGLPVPSWLAPDRRPSISRAMRRHRTPCQTLWKT